MTPRRPGAAGRGPVRSGETGLRGRHRHDRAVGHRGPRHLPNAEARAVPKGDTDGPAMRHQDDAATRGAAQQFAEQAGNALIQLAYRLPAGRARVRIGDAPAGHAQVTRANLITRMSLRGAEPPLPQARLEPDGYAQPGSDGKRRLYSAPQVAGQDEGGTRVGEVTSSSGCIRSAGRGQAGSRPGLALDDMLSIHAAITVADEKQGAWSLHGGSRPHSSGRRTAHAVRCRRRSWAL